MIIPEEHINIATSALVASDFNLFHFLTLLDTVSHLVVSSNIQNELISHVMKTLKQQR